MTVAGSLCPGLPLLLAAGQHNAVHHHCCDLVCVRKRKRHPPSSGAPDANSVAALSCVCSRTFRPIRNGRLRYSSIGEHLFYAGQRTMQKAAMKRDATKIQTDLIEQREVTICV